MKKKASHIKIHALLTSLFWLLGAMLALAQPANDNCSGAVNVPVNSEAVCTQSVTVSMPTNITASSVTLPECVQNTTARDIWYSFTAAEKNHFLQITNFTGATTPTNAAVVMALYGGDCNGLTELVCSRTNGLVATNLTVNETYYIRLLIDEATYSSTNFGFQLCIRGFEGQVGDGGCPLYTINSSFEEPVMSVQNAFYHHNRVLGWRTTASDQIMEFWESGFQGVPAYDGNQFVELNANVAGGLYQDFSTPAAITISYQFAHRGRSGGLANEMRLLTGPPGGPYTEVQTATGNNSSWTLHTGTFHVPDGQPLTRVIFVATNGGSQGNFLDAIKFEAQFGISSDHEVSITCVTEVTDPVAITGIGVGTWEADPNNPATVTFDNATSNATNVSGFTKSGTYKIYWKTLSCIDEMTVYVFLKPEPGELSADQTVCTGTTPAEITEVAAASGVGTLTYYWEQSQDGGVTWQLIPGAESASYQPPILDKTTAFRRFVIDDDGNGNQCVSLENESVTHTVEIIACGTISNPMLPSKSKKNNH